MTESTQASESQSTLTGCLARFFWMAAGNAALLILAVKIAQSAARALSVFDIAFWLTVVALVAVRFLDVTRLKGQTTDGEPATLAHWRRHALWLVVFSVALWLAAHGVAAAGWLQ